MAGLIKRSDRNDCYYIQYRVGDKTKRECLYTNVKQIAEQKLRDFETAQARGEEPSQTTKTPITDVLTKCVAYIRTRKTEKSVQTEIYYLREAFGPVAPYGYPLPGHRALHVRWIPTTA